MKTTDVLILGAGAAGMMCAATAAYAGQRVMVIDHARQAGRKILMSGGGRCNFTHLDAQPQHYLSSNPGFCISALKRYPPQAFLELVERHGIDWVEKTPGQLFCTHSSKDIQQLLLTEMDWAGASLHLSTRFDSMHIKADSIQVDTSLGRIEAGALVVATGGLSIPTLGATGLGYTLAEQLDVPVLPRSPALVPFTLSAEDKAQWSELSGLSCGVAVTCRGQTFCEPLLITHRGLSGPAMLQISSFWRPGDSLSINWLPGQDVAQRIQQFRQQQPRSGLVTLLSQQLPKRLAQRLADPLVQTLGLNPQAAQWSQAQMTRLHQSLSDWPIRPAGTEGYRTAEVTLGGVDTQAISSQDFSLRHCPQVRFIGEVLDVTGQLGGFNFQWAWASAVACGRGF